MESFSTTSLWGVVVRHNLKWEEILIILIINLAAGYGLCNITLDAYFVITSGV